MTAAPAKATLRFGDFRRVTAGICLALFLGLQFFAASRPLHHEVCADAAAPSHECAITLLAQGHVSPPPPVPQLLVALLGIALWIPAFQLCLRYRFDPVLIPTRGPPSR